MPIDLAKQTTFERLTAKVVVLFAKVKARKKQLEEKEKLMAHSIKELIKKNPETVRQEKENEEGEKVITYTYGPKDSPYELVHTLYQKSSISWKDEVERMYKLHYGKANWRKELDAFIDEQGKDAADKLDCKVNANYKQQAA